MATDDRVDKSIKHGGKREGSGRKAGVPNKVTASMKEAVSKAFDELGGWEWLVEVGRDDPRVVIPLFRQLMPKQVDMNGSLAVNMEMSHEAALQFFRENGIEPEIDNADNS